MPRPPLLDAIVLTYMYMCHHYVITYMAYVMAYVLTELQSQSQSQNYFIEPYAINKHVNQLF